MTPVRAGLERSGQIARLTLCRPKANVLDAEMVAALRTAVAGLSPTGPIKLVLIDHEGPHFSFGASVEEHLPGRVASMLASFHALFRELEGLGVPIAAVVRGQCLGGGLELALAAGRIFCDPSARMGAPEVKLAVFPPVASVLLPLRLPLPAATALVIGGEPVDGERAAAMGLADHCSADPAAAALEWFDAQLAPLSAVAVRHAWRAVRRPVARALADELAAVEAQYLEDLMTHADPERGLRAFLDRQTPTWEHA